MKILREMKNKSSLLFIAMIIASLFVVSCGGDESVDECTLALDKDCFCAENPTDTACFTCEADFGAVVYISGAVTDNEFVSLDPDDDNSDLFTTSLFVDGDDVSFYVYNSASDDDAVFGAAEGSGAEASGDLISAVDELCDDPELITVENTDQLTTAIVEVNAADETYSVTFVADPCRDLDLETQNRLWIKGGIAVPDGDGGYTHGFQDVAGNGIQLMEAEDGWYEAIVDHYVGWFENDLSFQIVMNPVGSYGGDFEIDGDSILVADFGAANEYSTTTDGCYEAGKGAIYGKFFYSVIDGKQKVSETIADCTDVPTWVDGEGNEQVNNANDTRVCYPIPGEPEVFKVRFNPVPNEEGKFEYEVIFTGEPATRVDL